MYQQHLKIPFRGALLYLFQISSSEDSSQQVAVRSSQSSALPYVYNSMQYLSTVSQIPYTMVHLPTQMQHGEMYPNIDPITLSAAYMD